MSALARIKKTAAQHEQERQYDKALALYARILDGAEAGEEEVDVALFNRAGDLALRLGDAPRAVSYFERALDLYASTGLLNNAVALGVKILRHAPNHLSAHYTLGVLYGRKGFLGDARHHLLTYAVQMQRAGRVDETSRVLAEVAAACADVGELRAAFDAYSALGGDPAYAAPLAADAPAAAAPAQRPTPAFGTARVGRGADPAFLDLTPGAPAAPAAPAPVAPAAVDGGALTLEPAIPDAAPAAAGYEPEVPAVAVAELDLMLPDADDAGVGAGAPPLVFLDVAAEAAAGAPENGLDLAMLDEAAIDVAHPAASPAARPAALAAAGVADAHWAPTLPNEPPPLRLADLADRPVDRMGDRAGPSMPSMASVPAVPGVPALDLAAFDPGPFTPAPLADAPAAAAGGGDDDGLDLGAWLRETTPEESTRMTTAAVPESGDEQAVFDATLRAFTAGVQRVVGHEDFDSHYDLGVAFREMGLVDEAIVQFQRAAQAPGRPLRALEALAQCFLDLDQPELALSTLAGPAVAADAGGAGDASLIAVHYLMGAAAQALGRPEEARRWLVRVVATDVRFRDASSRLAALPPPALTR